MNKKSVVLSGIMGIVGWIIVRKIDEHIQHKRRIQEMHEYINYMSRSR